MNKILLMICFFSLCACNESSYSSDKENIEEGSALANANLSGINMKSSVSDCGFFLFEAGQIRSGTAFGYSLVDTFDVETNTFLDNDSDGAYSSAVSYMELNPSSISADVICTDKFNKVIAFRTIGGNSDRAHLSVAQKIRVINEILFQFGFLTPEQLNEFSNGVALPELPDGWMNLGL